jgi:hypothetical protein
MWSFMEDRFEALYAQWKKAVRDSRIALSSVSEDFTSMREYVAMSDLGIDALPYILAKIEEGEVLLASAAMAASGLELRDLVEADRSAPFGERILPEGPRGEFVGEKQKAKLVLQYLPGLLDLAGRGARR